MSDPRQMMVQAVADVMQSATELGHSEIAEVLGIGRKRWHRARQQGVGVITMARWLELWAAAGHPAIDFMVGRNWATASLAPVLTAVDDGGLQGWSVEDEAGGVWWPSDEAALEIEAAQDPGAAAVRIATDEPMRGEWCNEWDPAPFAGAVQ